MNDWAERSVSSREVRSGPVGGADARREEATCVTERSCSCRATCVLELRDGAASHCSTWAARVVVDGRAPRSRASSPGPRASSRRFRSALTAASAFAVTGDVPLESRPAGALQLRDLLLLRVDLRRSAFCLAWHRRAGRRRWRATASKPARAEQGDDEEQRAARRRMSGRRPAGALVRLPHREGDVILRTRLRCRAAARSLAHARRWPAVRRWAPTAGRPRLALSLAPSARTPVLASARSVPGHELAARGPRRSPTSGAARPPATPAMRNGPNGTYAAQARSARRASRTSDDHAGEDRAGEKPVRSGRARGRARRLTRSFTSPSPSAPEPNGIESAKGRRGRGRRRRPPRPPRPSTSGFRPVASMTSARPGSSGSVMTSGSSRWSRSVARRRTRTANQAPTRARSERLGAPGGERRRRHAPRRRRTTAVRQSRAPARRRRPRAAGHRAAIRSADRGPSAAPPSAEQATTRRRHRRGPGDVVDASGRPSRAPSSASSTSVACVTPVAPRAAHGRAFRR